jgi:hypothetical protein
MEIVAYPLWLLVSNHGLRFHEPQPDFILAAVRQRDQSNTVAFETHLVAIRWYLGNYDVASQIIADIQFGPLRHENRIFDVSENPGYVDEAAVLSHLEFAKYLFPGESAARAWYEALPEQVSFIMVHNVEWESGLGD